MKTFFLIVIALLMSAINMQIIAQEADTSLKTNYEQQTIYLDGTTNKYVKKNENKKIGLFGKKLKHEFENSSLEAKQEIEIYSRHNKLGAIFSSVGLVIVFTTTILIPEIVFPIYLGLTVIGYIPTTIGIIHLIKAPRHLNKAIWLYNRDVILKN
jgi:hypothetical protein